MQCELKAQRCSLRLLRSWKSSRQQIPQVAENIGGAEGIRTLDLLDAIEARSQLRHGPTAGRLSAFITSPRGKRQTSGR